MSGRYLSLSWMCGQLRSSRIVLNTAELSGVFKLCAYDKYWHLVQTLCKYPEELATISAQSPDSNDVMFQLRVVGAEPHPQSAALVAH
jgi:hypothetical protein